MKKQNIMLFLIMYVNAEVVLTQVVEVEDDGMIVHQ